MNVIANLSELVKQLREKTGYGLMDCNKTLKETNGDLQAAEAILRKKYADKYATASEDGFGGRETSVTIMQDAHHLGYCFIKANSDVITRSKEIFNFACKLFSYIDGKHDSEEATMEFVKNSSEFKNLFDGVIAHFREPVILEAINIIDLSKTKFANAYIHNKLFENNDKAHHNDFISGQKGAVTVIESDRELNLDESEKVNRLAYAISMAMIANETTNIMHEHEIDAQMLIDFKAQSTEDAAKSGKPANVVEKIVAGQVKRFLEEKLLGYSEMIGLSKLEWLKPNDKGELTINEALDQTAKVLACKLTIPFYKILRVVK